MPEPALLAHDLVRVLGGRRVLDGVCLTAAPGHRIGLIGENGVGKSTLLRLLAGTDRPDSGHVVRPADLGFLHQELPHDPASTLADVVDGALREARAALTELDRLTGLLETTPQDAPEYATLLAAYGRQLENAERQEVWEADRRAAAVLAGLGLGALDHGRSLASLSGGQRGRLALAALLVRRPTALLLDEPTNHLDDEAAAFLEERLRELPGTVVAASHDRAFLDAVCTDLIDLDPVPGGPVRHGGTYSSYLAGGAPNAPAGSGGTPRSRRNWPCCAGRPTPPAGGPSPAATGPTTRRWGTATARAAPRHSSPGGPATRTGAWSWRSAARWPRPAGAQPALRRTGRHRATGPGGRPAGGRARPAGARTALPSPARLGRR
ncbi:ATP-binding cassette domain-containing protein [Actinomadura keratinilytica]